MKLNIILIYLLKVTEQNGDFALKKKLLDNWDIRDNYYDARGEIVIEDDIREKSTETSSDEIIILPFFSDEVLSLDDIPEDTNWNFVEINSATDLLAMENPHQKKYKTQSYKGKTKAEKRTPRKRKNHNNWDKFKSRFPIYVQRGFAPASRIIPELGIPLLQPTKKEKRQTHYYPTTNIDEELEAEAIALKVNPWENVNIIEDKSPQLAFGVYDEFGNKVQRKRNTQISEVKYRDFRELHKFGDSDQVTRYEPLLRNKKEIGNEEQVINITIDLDKVESVSKIPKLNIRTDRVAGFNQFQAIREKKPAAAQIPAFQSFQTNLHTKLTPVRNKVPPFQVFKANAAKSNNKETVKHEKPSTPGFQVFKTNVENEFVKEKVFTPELQAFEAVRRKKLVNKDIIPVTASISAVQGYEEPVGKKNDKVSIHATTPLPVFQVFEANKGNEKESARLVFKVFSPNSEEILKDLDEPIPVVKPANTKKQSLSTTFKETLGDLHQNFTVNPLSKRIDKLYNKLATLKNFEAFQGSPSEEMKNKHGQAPSGVSKLVKPVAVVMKNYKIKLTKPVVLNLQSSANINNELSIQNQLLAKLKRQVQGLRPQKPDPSQSNQHKHFQPPRPKRARPPKPEGTPRNKHIVVKVDPLKNTSHKRDLKPPTMRRNSKGMSHKRQPHSNKSQPERPQTATQVSSQVKPLVVSSSMFTSVPKRNHPKATQLSNHPAQPHHGLPPEVQTQPKASAKHIIASRPDNPS